VIDFSNTTISLSRKITDYAKVKVALGHVLRGNRLQLSRRRAFRKPYVNIGCGPNVRSGFVNIDYCWNPGIDLVWDLCDGIPLSDNRYDGAFTEHCLEHIALDKCRFVLREIKRILKPGAILRVVVPDAGKYLDLYQARKTGSDDKFPYEDQRVLSGLVTPMMIVNDVFRGHGHLYAYDAETLRTLLADAGFTGSRVERFGSGAKADLLLDSPGRIIESLYVEALA
jgi:predicted SAM-dependent methyltransferase